MWQYRYCTRHGRMAQSGGPVGPMFTCHLEMPCNTRVSGGFREVRRRSAWRPVYSASGILVPRGAMASRCMVQHFVHAWQAPMA